MFDSNIPLERLRHLNEHPVSESGQYVVYWMQQSQRTEYNFALEYAVQQANILSLPLVVVFGLMDNYPDANLRHYYFMLEGLREVEQGLKERNIAFVLRIGHPVEVALKIGGKASLIVCDVGYLRHQKEWRKTLASKALCKVVQVESDVVVPVEVVSQKHEFSARTIRPKIHRLLYNYLSNPGIAKANIKLNYRLETLDLSDIIKACNELKLNREVLPVPQFFKGGETQAKLVFSNFISDKIARYIENRNQPHTDDISYMSMYLHFGHISPVYMINKLKEVDNKEAVETYIEELVVRRELSINFVHFCPDYDNYKCIPDWAKKTLNIHQFDNREHQYSLEQMEKSLTADIYWNASMGEMKYTGFMHNYMRMYWGKKILEWSASPEEAFYNCSYLNNKYFLCGRDPNGYANVAWIFGLHDRAWGENPVFGKVRIMKASGLKRKFNPQLYIDKVEKLKKQVNELFL